MQLQALIIDDEPLAHDIIQAYADDVPFLDITGNCHLATEALTYLHDHEVDLIFLDINMPKLKGLDFLRVLKDPPVVVVTSAYEEYALESFELDVCDYLHKPFRFDRFLKAVERARERVIKRNEEGIGGEKRNRGENAKNDKEIQKQLFIKIDKKFIQLNLTDIQFLESYGNYVKVWLEKEYHMTLRTLSSFEKQLEEATNFFRIHKSYIINKSHIDTIEGNQVTMKNNQVVSIGKSYKEVIKELIK